MKNFIGVITFASGFLALTHGAIAQEGITRDPLTGDYQITYQEYDASGTARLVRKTFVPKTKVAPAINSSWKWKDSQTIIYKYDVANGATAKQDIHMFIVDPAKSIVSAEQLPLSAPRGSSEIKLASKSMSNAAKSLGAPKSWYSTVAFSKYGPGLRVGWTYQSEGGVRPGESQLDYSYESRDLPGIVMAAVSGSAPPGQGIGENAPDANTEFGKQYRDLITRNFVSVPVAAPTISAAQGTNIADVLKAVQSNLRAWPSMNVMDQAMVSKVDGALNQASTALAANDANAALAALKSARKMLKPHSESAVSADKVGKGHPTLGEDVLTFNLRYMSKVLNRGQEVND